MLLAEKQGVSWHGWVTGMIRRSIKRDPATKEIYREKTDQEKVG